MTWRELARFEGKKANKNDGQPSPADGKKKISSMRVERMT